MYLQNKYYNIYKSIVNRAKGRTLADGIYFETHHIIPRSLGGSNRKENLVRLTAREHYICHRLLIKITEGAAKRSMIYAAYMMMKGTKRYKPSSRIYEILRNQMREANRERPGPNLGKKLSDEWKNNIKKSFTVERREDISEARKGKATRPKGTFTVSDETRKKMSESRGTHGTRFGTHSEETKQKLKEARAKQIFTEDTYRKRSEAMKGRPKSLEHNLKNSLAQKGKVISEETRAKISATLKTKNAEKLM